LGPGDATQSGTSSRMKSVERQDSQAPGALRDVLLPVNVVTAFDHAYRPPQHATWGRMPRRVPASPGQAGRAPAGLVHRFGRVACTARFGSLLRRGKPRFLTAPGQWTGSDVRSSSPPALGRGEFGAVALANPG